MIQIIDSKLSCGGDSKVVVDNRTQTGDFSINLAMNDHFDEGNWPEDYCMYSMLGHSINI